MGRRSLRSGGLTQSGSIVEDIYKKIFPELKKILKGKNGKYYSSILSKAEGEKLSKEVLGGASNNKSDINNILILGLGGGSFAKLSNKHFPEANITGIEIDQKIIALSIKYLDLSSIKNLNIVCDDAISYIKNRQVNKKFDLIFADLYSGEQISPAMEDQKFIDALKKLLTDQGILVFNRFNWGKYKLKNNEFIKTLQQIFPTIKIKKSYSNLIVFAF